MSIVANYFRSYTKYDILLGINLFAAGLTMTILFTVSTTNPDVQKDTKRFPISQLMLSLSIIGTIVSIM